MSRQAVELNGARGFQTEVVLREDLKQRYLVLHSPTGSVLLVGTWMRDRDRQYVDQFLDSLRFNP